MERAGSILEHVHEKGRNMSTMQYKNFIGQDLSNHNFSGMDLTGSNFKDANLFKADFRGATLHYCNFMHANVEGAMFDENTKTMFSAWLVRVPPQHQGKYGAQNRDLAIGLSLVDDKTYPPGYFDNDMDHDGKPDGPSINVGGVTITQDEDSINIDIDGDGSADIVLPKKGRQ